MNVIGNIWTQSLQENIFHTVIHKSTVIEFYMYVSISFVFHKIGRIDPITSTKLFDRGL